jgi:hypothetical protein
VNHGGELRLDSHATGMHSRRKVRLGAGPNGARLASQGVNVGRSDGAEGEEAVLIVVDLDTNILKHEPAPTAIGNE